MAIQGKRLQLTLAITGATAWILQGFDQALMNGILTLPSFTETFPSIDTSTPELDKQHSTLTGTAVALYEVGAAVGALSCYFIGEYFGRKRTTFGAAVVVLIGVIIQSTSYQLAQLIVGRIIVGLGVGSFTATIPSWVGESSTEAGHRGWLVMLEGSAAIFGIVMIGWIELGLYFVPNNNAVSWRFPIAFQAVFALIVLCVVPLTTESPRWLLSKDRHADARTVMARLLAEKEDSELVSAQLQVIQNSIYLDQQGHSKNPFAKTPNRHLNRTLLAIGINVLAQMSGVNVITFYSNTIFQRDLGYSPVLSRIITSCLQTWQFLNATAAVFLIDRFGRRRLLMVCAALMAVANSGLAGLQSHAAGNPTIAGCSLIFYFIALAAFPIGLFLIPFMYASEIAPLRIRSQVAAMASASNWLFNFLIAEVTPIAFSNIGWKYYLVFVCTNTLSFTVFYFFAPETKGRTLEDIDAIFLESSNALEVVKVAKTLPAGIAEEYDLATKPLSQVEFNEKSAV
ncbi:hexose transporter [Polychaeton citri CBS 116435]|uniref:Hexose transporter n=1 Tax=Polychaeton citri CBS 116435 TaxID=1314669 RepID=A0A9P4USV4_9PEZI|nr:hexose transporter [Polychaeton citri CBS 116435]